MTTVFEGSIVEQSKFFHQNETMPSTAWTHDELLLAMNLYCRLPFGRLHTRNPDIVALANFIGRTPGAVSMKLVNFASFDPAHQSRGVKGLKNAGKLDREVWEEFQNDWESLSFESQKAYQGVIESNRKDKPIEPSLSVPQAESEREATVRIRLVQGFFRDAVLSSYEESCSFCGTDRKELLNASHIIPWSMNVERRADPTNGICLCALHDRAFDRGLISIDEKMQILVSTKAKQGKPSKLYKIGILDAEDMPITLPKRFLPDETALDYHRNEIFQA